MPPFERIIVIDWSGAGTEAAPADIRVVEWKNEDGRTDIVSPPRPARTRWSRAALESWLWSVLQLPQRTLVACDFAFGLPWRSDAAMFGCESWRELIRHLAERYSHRGSARETATALNMELAPGPFRFDGSRNDHRFYLQYGVAYYRLAEIAAPQSISPWYLGSGGTVGFHTITGLAMLHRLLTRRDKELRSPNFEVWPQETWIPKSCAHLIVECYPAMAQAFDTDAVQDTHTRDALRVLRWLLSLDTHEWNQLFTITEIPFGRYHGVTFQAQVQFEGWILGLR